MDNYWMMIVLGVLIVAIVILCVFYCRKKEAFAGLGHSFTYKVDREMKEPNNMFYSVPGNYQAILSPRFSSTDYGAHIKYNMPSKAMQGVPTNPLTFGNMVRSKPSQIEGYSKNLKENYPSCCCPSGAGQPMTGISRATAPGPSKQQIDQEKNLKYTEVTDLLPVADMMTGPQQPIIYDRFMYANQKSRLYAASDYIRGDLPIVPCQTGWFRPSVHPHLDLNQGALGVVAGPNNETSNELKTLMNASMAGTLATFSGVPAYQYANAGTVQKSIGLSGGGADVIISAFP